MRLQSPWWAGVLTVVLRGCAETVSSIVVGEPQAAVGSQGELAEDQAMGEDPAPAPAGNEAAGEDVVVNVGPADAAAEDPDEQERQRLQERLLQERLLFSRL